MSDVRLHHDWASEASHRVRIALALKGIAVESRLVDVAAKEHETEAYRAINPLGLVPALEIDGEVLTQSLAIIDYLDETRAHPALLPGFAAERARVRAIGQAIAADVAPLIAPAVIGHLDWLTASGAAGRANWARKWLLRGLAAVERMLDSPMTGAFCHGAEPGYADCLLIPHIRLARAWGAPLWRFPRVTAIELGCASHPAFAAADPERWRPTPTDKTEPA